METRGETIQKSSIIQTLTLGLIIRLGAIFYSEWHDIMFPVPFTDVDYHVFTDAARYITENNSPYLRSTYRYPPILAYILTPNLYIHRTWGKILFCIFDLASAYISASIAKGRRELLIGVFNPFSIVIAARGNSDSLIAVVVLITLWSSIKSRPVTAGIFLALAVHIRIYPIIFSLAVFLSFGSDKQSCWRRICNPNINQILLVICSLATFTVLTLICYVLYGTQYLEESLFYHMTRRDTRHNFSLLFYLLYLHPGQPFWMIFLPQIILLFVTSVVFSSKLDLPFCFFTQTVIFITFNPVITSQYWVWCLSLLPCTMSKIDFESAKWAGLAVLWLLPQFAWLLPAYLLEFRGRNTFIFIFIQSVGVFCANVACLVRLIRSYRRHLKND